MMKTPPKKIVVFLGPSLSLHEAKTILPGGLFLPPVQCGDILRVLRLKPDVIAIIDGFFEHTAAVWHKEILYALDQGIRVFGASSMGALRAAELTEYGMEGVGQIFQDYNNGTLTDDDEVAILHNPSHLGYSPLTDAMVNIRATLKKAVSENILSQNESNTLVTYAKQLYYQQRFWCDVASNANISLATKKKLSHWLGQDQFVDQKKTMPDFCYMN